MDTSDLSATDSHSPPGARTLKAMKRDRWRSRLRMVGLAVGLLILYRVMFPAPTLVTILQNGQPVAQAVVFISIDRHVTDSKGIAYVPTQRLKGTQRMTIILSNTSTQVAFDFGRDMTVDLKGPTVVVKRQHWMFPFLQQTRISGPVPSITKPQNNNLPGKEVE